MFADTIATLFTLFFVEPLDVAIREKLASAQAPQEIVRQVASCAQRGGPILAERTMAEPGWAAATVVRLFLETATLESVLGDIDPECKQAFQAARPFLQG